MRTKITRHGQITLPKAVREHFRLAEGDYVDVEIMEEERGILLRPKKVQLVGPDQAYYWTDTWQAMEQEADADIAAGRVHKIESLDDLDAK